MQALLSEHYQQLQPYKAGLTSENVRQRFGLEQVYKFASNESPFPPSPKAILAAQQALQLAHRYPDYDQLKEAIARHCNVEAPAVLLGTGSVNVLDLLFLAFAAAGHNVVFSECSYFAYPLLAQKAGLTVRLAAAGPQLNHVVDHLLAACNEHTRLLVLDNPGNFSGAALTVTEIQHLLRQVSRQTLVVLDQAYADFADLDNLAPSSDLFREFPNLIITRTFSKSHALAALRVGYALGAPELIDWLQRGQQPFPVSNVGCAAAISALQDEDYMASVVAQTKQGRIYLSQALQSLGLRVYTSHGNFVLADFGEQAAALYQQLLAKGFITRQMTVYQRPDLIRISVGTSAENELLVRQIRMLLNG